MKPTVLLFDVDGTLLDTGGVGRRCLAMAFQELYDRPDACSSFSLGGMTDRAIFRQGLEAISAPVTREAVDELLRVYLGVLAAEMVAATTPRLHAGILSALDAAENARCALGLGTGNVRDGARIKLERVGVYHRFGFGGFGSDHELRPEILRVGAERGAAILGASVEACRVVVIGDTPKDIAAAHAIGAQCIAVATGTFTLESLRTHTPDFAFQTLEDPAAIGALVD